jgi:hypothetical protein
MHNVFPIQPTSACLALCPFSPLYALGPSPMPIYPIYVYTSKGVASYVANEAFASAEILIMKSHFGEGRKLTKCDSEH